MLSSYQEITGKETSTKWLTQKGAFGIWLKNQVPENSNWQNFKKKHYLTSIISILQICNNAHTKRYSEQLSFAIRKVVIPILISSISSSPPTISAPAALASSAAAPSAKTATLTV